MLPIIRGSLGSGKTLFMVREACKLHLAGKKIYANFNLRFPDGKKAEKLTIDLLTPELSDCVVLIDEAYAWLESRTSMKLLNRYLTYILFQSRKRNLDFYLTTQLISAIEMRFQNLADHLITARLINSRSAYSKKEFQYDVISYTPSGKRVRRVFTISYDSARKKYFDLYDTREVISVDKEKDYMYELLKRNDKKYTQKLLELASEVIDVLQDAKATKDTVRVSLLELQESVKYTNDVYGKIKMLT